MEPLVAAHAHEMFGVLSDPAIYESANAPPPSEEWLRSRYRRLEQRRSPDGNELWLNWVARVPCGELVGYVQATVLPSGVSYIACVAAADSARLRCRPRSCWPGRELFRDVVKRERRAISAARIAEGV